MSIANNVGEATVTGTYKEIQSWVKYSYGFVAQTCYIAHVKEMCGLPLRKAWNRPDATKRVKPCPPGKVEPIKQAFKHFGMI